MVTRKRQVLVTALASGASWDEAIAAAGYTRKYAGLLWADEGVQEAVARRRAYLDSLDARLKARLAITARRRETEIMARLTVDDTQAPRVRAASVTALGHQAERTGDVAIIQHIKMLADDTGQHERVRIAALRALGRLVLAQEGGGSRVARRPPGDRARSARHALDAPGAQVT